MTTNSNLRVWQPDKSSLSYVETPLESSVWETNMQKQSCYTNIMNFAFFFLIKCTNYKLLSYRITQYTPLGVMLIWFLMYTPPFGINCLANILVLPIPSKALSASSIFYFIFARLPSTRKYAPRALFHVPKKSTKPLNDTNWTYLTTWNRFSFEGKEIFICTNMLLWTWDCHILHYLLFVARYSCFLDIA